MADETKIIRIVVDSSAAIDGSRRATDALARMERSLDQSKTALERMEAGLGRVGGFLKAQIALQVAELGSRLIEMGRQAFEAAAGLDELAEQLGTNARALQGLQYQAGQYGVKAEQLETALSKFSQKMGEAADGSKDMVEALNALGVKNLDFQGKLRPTEALMQDVAAAIVSIEDPAKRSAAAVDFFGKAGTRMLPMLGEIAKGADNMAAAAERAGAMISGDTIARLDKLSDKMEANRVKWRAQMAEVAAALDEAREGFNKWATETGAGAEAWLKRQADGLNEWAQGLSEAVAMAGARASAMFLEAFRAMPDQLGKLFTDALNKAIEAVEAGLNKILSGLSNSPLGQFLGIGGGSVSLGRMSGGGASFGDYTGQIGAAGDAAAGSMAGVLAARREAMARQALINRQAGMEGDEANARVGKLAGVYAPGASTSAVKGAGGSEADAIAKAMRGARLDADTQTALAEASERGARAVADLETHFKALKAAQDAYGKTADQNTAGVAALTAELEKLMAAADKGKALKDFNLGTADLEKANELLEAENQLVNASAEVRARELAIIKTRQEILSKGLDETNAKEREAIERRYSAIEQNERLKAQGEEIKKANELWTAPLKSALESIQRTGADMWEQLLENGKFSAEEFGQIFIKMARRAAAELLALATIRPVISVAMQGLGSVGLVSPGTATALGYPSSGGGGGSIGGLGGMGGGSLFGGGLFGSTGGGSSSGWLGNIGSWLNSPIGGSWSGISNVPAGAFGPAPNTTGGLGLSGTTWGQGLGAAAGAGMGIYQLATAKGNTAKTIGGIASLVGAGVSLIPGVGQIAGPIIGMLGGLLPSLFGEGEKIPPMPPLDYGAGVINPAGMGFSYAENQLNGGKGMGGAASSIGGSVMGLFKRAGLTGVPGMLIGGDIASGMNSVWSGGQWQQSPYTQVGLHTPGGYERLTYNDSSRTPEQAADLLVAAMFRANVLRGGVTGASPALQTAVANSQPNTAKAVQDLIDFVNAYDKLGQSAATAKDALIKLGDQFGEMAATAGGYGLSGDPIAAEYNKQKFRYAQDFIDGMLDPLAVQLRALEDQKNDSIASAEYIRDKVGGVYVDINKITEYWLKKELDLKAQYAEKSVGLYQDLIDRLTYGDLANATPTQTYGGTRASYMATLAQAQAGDPTAAGNLGGVAEAYANASRSYFGSSAEYAALAEQIRSDLVAQQSKAIGGDAGAQSAQINELIRSAANDREEMRALREQIAALTAQMARR